MRIALANWRQHRLTVDSASRIPVAGSESALCYLAEALAKLGHDVFLLSPRCEPTVSNGVQCLPSEVQIIYGLRPLDALVVQNCAGLALKLRPLLAPNGRLILWTQHAHDQPAMESLHDPLERDAYDGIAFVSEWQRQEFIRHYGVDPNRCALMHNAIGTWFRDLFPDSTSILAQKADPPVLVYTSTPFRGLDVLLNVFPRIRQAVPGATLKVFSSMQIYQVSAREDVALFGALYQRCRDMPGVEYHGSVPQPALAGELRSAAMLAYPNTFAETSCIAALEAMAAGCWIVTSQFGALPETTAGFARLIPFATMADAAYQQQFVETAVQALEQRNMEAESTLRRQVAYANEFCTWPIRAKEWVKWLETMQVRQ